MIPLMSGYEASIQAGDNAKLRILASPEMIDSDGMAALLDTTPDEVEAMHENGALLSFEDLDGFVLFPVWQADCAIQPDLPQLLAALSNLDPWTQYLFLTQKNPVLNAACPLDALRAGKRLAVFEAAAQYSEELTPA